MISNADLLLHVASGRVVRPAYLDKAEYIFKIGLEMFEHIRARPANRYYDDVMIGDNFVTCQDDFTIGSIKRCYLADAWRIDRYIRDAIFALQTISFNSKRDPEHPEVANMSCFELLNGQGINDNSTYNTFFTEFWVERSILSFVKVCKIISMRTLSHPVTTTLLTTLLLL